MVGKIDNVEQAVSSGWKKYNDSIWIVGSYNSESTLAASSYLEYFHGKVTGRPPKIDLEKEKYFQKFLRTIILKNFVSSSHDVSDGGLAIALSECCVLSSKGAIIDLDSNKCRLDNILFSEGGSRIIFSVDKNQEINWLNYLKDIKNDFPTTFM